MQISGKVAGAFARILETFQGTHILGASRGRLCDSKAFLLEIDACRYSLVFLGKRATSDGGVVDDDIIFWLIRSLLLKFWR